MLNYQRVDILPEQKHRKLHDISNEMMCHKCQARHYIPKASAQDPVAKIHRGQLRRNCRVSYPKVMDRIISQSSENYAMIHVLFGDVFQHMGGKIKGTRRIGKHSKHSKHILNSEIYDPIGLTTKLTHTSNFFGMKPTNQAQPTHRRLIFVQLRALNLDAPHPTRGHVRGPRSHWGFPWAFEWLVTYMCYVII